MNKYGIITSSGKIIKIEDLVDTFEISTKSKETSTQPKDEYMRYRPYDMWKIDRLSNSCVYITSAADIVAKDVVGSGYEILATSEKENEELKKRIENWIDNQDLLDTLYKCIVDYKIYGEGILEKADTTLYYMPTRYTNLMQDKDILKLWYNGHEVHYKRYGANKKEDINEFIRFKNHNREDRDYGRPALIDIEGAVIGNLLVRNYNNSFFENYGMPAGIITVSGNYDEGNIDENGVSDFQKSLQEQIKDFKSNPGTTMVFAAKANNQGDKVDIKVEPLGTQKDGDFLNFKKANDDEIIAGLRVPEYLYGINKTGNLGGDNSKQATEIYKRHELQPIKTMVEKIVNTLIKDLFATDIYKFELRALDNSDRDADLDYAIKILDKGGMKLGDFVKQYGSEFGTKTEDLGDLANAIIYNGEILNPIESGVLIDNPYQEALEEVDAAVSTKSKGFLSKLFK